MIFETRRLFGMADPMRDELKEVLVGVVNCGRDASIFLRLRFPSEADFNVEIVRIKQNIHEGYGDCEFLSAWSYLDSLRNNGLRPDQIRARLELQTRRRKVQNTISYLKRITYRAFPAPG